MSLAKARDAGPRPSDYRRRGCGFGRWMRSLPVSEQDALDAMLDPDSGWEHAQIAQEIADDDDYPGVEFRPGAVAYHRGGACTCEPV